MALPINIEELIHGQSLEWDRLEFKKGWHPEETIHSICAFANDINNWGGGYVIIGIEEHNGRPVFPPEGIAPQRLDSIQGELVKICHQITPNYIPATQPYVFQNKHILVIWVPAGDIRPYTAPSTHGKNARWQPYIRFGSRSIVAVDANLRRLQELTARIPFDDRINNQASVKNFDLGLIRSFLQEIKSDLFEESLQISFNDLCRQLHIAKGSDEDLRPINSGLLFFCNQPETYFNRAWIEVVIRKDETGDDFEEKYFKGPLHIQLRNALDYIRNQIIVEKVKKIQGQAEAQRFYNFPFAAIEEALANAVYHKSYELDKPIEVQIWPDKIEILSFPGPVPPVNSEILATQRRVVARDYRNRRIGDFLKELHLTEGRGTGVPKIYRALERNGSPMPVLETDPDCNYFLTVIYAHPDAKSVQASNQDNIQNINSLDDLNALFTHLSDQASDQVSDQVTNQVTDKVTDKVKSLISYSFGDKAELILVYLSEMPRKSRDILEDLLGVSLQTKNKKRYLDPLLNENWIELTIKENQNDRNQKYQLTEKGRLLVKILTK
ncbi:MAG: putative DNA binding domain-containing protein [Bacteroidota bacterium]|nr:putative DNA binding domain-containing protein [Bacteroidota bacterium]